MLDHETIKLLFERRVRSLSFLIEFCRQNIKQHRIFRSVVLFVLYMILSGSGERIGSFRFLF